MSLAERLSRFCLKLELVLIAGAKAVHGAHLVGAQGLAEQVDRCHLGRLVLVRDGDQQELQGVFFLCELPNFSKYRIPCKVA